MNRIRITTLQCGTMTVQPKEAYMSGIGLGSKRITLPVNAFLIEHPVHGRILVDTGWSADAEDILPAHLKNFYRPEIRPGETAKEQLAALGIMPENIDLVLLTHLDVDHTCALKDFAGRAKSIQCAELEYFYSCRTVYKRREVWDTWIPYNDMIEKRNYYSSVLGPQGRGFDLFGDDSVLCIYSPGHTDGIFTTIVSEGPSNRFKTHGSGIYGGSYVVLASDVAFSQKNIDDEVVPGYGFSRPQQKKSLQFLKKLQADPKHAATLFSHSAPAEKVIEF